MSSSDRSAQSLATVCAHPHRLRWKATTGTQAGKPSPFISLFSPPYCFSFFSCISSSLTSSDVALFGSFDDCSWVLSPFSLPPNSRLASAALPLASAFCSLSFLSSLPRPWRQPRLPLSSPSPSPSSPSYLPRPWWQPLSSPSPRLLGRGRSLLQHVRAGQGGHAGLVDHNLPPCFPGQLDISICIIY